MSRIHEALRQAAEEQATPETPAPLEGDTISALAKEPFPVELGAPRNRRAPAIETELPADTDSDASDDSSSNATDEPSVPRRDSLFERIDSRMAEKIVADENMSPVSREQYRRLAGVLLDAQGNNGTKVIMVASAVPGEGKTLTAVNLALTLSESYRRRVMLIDADLRKPTVDRVFRLNASSGLVEGLDPNSNSKLVVRQVSTNLAVLPAGRPTSDPMAALTSDRMRHLLDEAKASFDWVVIDTPPLMLLPDAHLLSSIVDGAVLVIKARSTAHNLVKRTAEIIGRSRILGVVLNQADRREHGYNDYYGGYYLPSKGESKPQ